MPAPFSERLMARIYMPKVTAEDIEKLKSDQPFLMRVNLPIGSTFVDVCAVPSIVDMMGMSGGGGPPAFAYLIDPDQKETEKRLLMTAMPEHAFFWPPDDLDVSVMPPLGVVQCMGMLLMCFQWRGEDIAKLEQHFTNHGVFIIDTQPYKVPPMLRVIQLSKMAQVQAQNAAVQKDR